MWHYFLFQTGSGDPKTIHHVCQRTSAPHLFQSRLFLFLCPAHPRALSILTCVLTLTDKSRLFLNVFVHPTLSLLSPSLFPCVCYLAKNSLTDVNVEFGACRIFWWRQTAQDVEAALYTLCSHKSFAVNKTFLQEILPVRTQCGLVCACSQFILSMCKITGDKKRKY